jgi:hypothetical protein
MRSENFPHHCQVLCSHQNRLTGTTLDGKRTCFNTTKSHGSFHFVVLKYAVGEREKIGLYPTLYRFLILEW